MQIHESLSKQFSRLEEITGIIRASVNADHIIDMDKIELMREVVDEGLTLSKSLMNNREYHGLYDIEAGHWLKVQRAVIKDAHGDLSLPWNQPPEHNPNKVHGTSGDGDEDDLQTFEGGLNFMGVLDARRMEKERLSDG